MGKPLAKVAIGFAILFAATIALLIHAMLGQAKVSCEVCVSFHGGTKCRTAAGPNKTEATKTATDNACGYLASGMADSVSCANTVPLQVSCDGP